MAKFKINDMELDAPENLIVGEVLEAEKYLGFSMDAGGIAGFAISLFVAMRKAEPEKHGADIAATVLACDLASIEEVEQVGPPAEAAEAAETPGSPDGQATSGPLRSVSTA